MTIVAVELRRVALDEENAGASGKAEIETGVVADRNVSKGAELSLGRTEETMRG